MSLQPDSEQSGSQQTAVPFGFAGKPSSSLGPRTVINPERVGLVPSESGELPPSGLAKRRRLFPGEEAASSEISAAADDSALGPTGVELAHFTVEQPIGRGGMGAVYRAVDTRLERVVALKVLAPEQAGTQNAVQRFVNEARASARLDHDNIARVYFVGEDDGLHFIAYEFVTGTNIRDLIQQTGRLDPAEAINYTLQVAAALKHTSAAGVVHRDVKPSNIIVTPAGRAKLVDLGLARKEYTESVDELTVAGTTLGTFDYISPEQAKDPRNVDVRSDIYSLGCTLYQMLTGEPPYPEGTMYQKLLKHDGKEPPDPARKNSRVPAELSAVVRKMMASDPQRRYRDADDLIRDLMTVAGTLGIRTVSPDGLIWSAEMTRRPAGFWRRHLGWMATAAMLVLIVFLLDRYQDRLDFGVGGRTGSGAAQPDAAPPDASTHVAADDRPASGNRPSSTAAGGSAESPDAFGPPDDRRGAAVEPIKPPGNQPPKTASDTTPPDVSREPTKTVGPPQDEPGPTPDGAVAAKKKPEPSDDVPQKTSPAKATPNARPVDAPKANLPRTVPEPQIVLVTAGDEKPFNTLEAACADAKDGGVIVLRYNGARTEAERKPLRLNNKRLTIRGEKGFRPLIEFRPKVDSAREWATQMITLIGGYATSIELTNVDVRVVLPAEADPNSEWALFSLGGAEQVRLKDVRVTFDNPDGRYEEARLIEFKSGPSGNPADMKMMKKKPPGARSEFDVRITESFIRGGCDLFHVAHTRPGRFSVDHSAIAIDGTLLSMIGDLEMPADDADLELQLEYVTALLGGGLIRFNSDIDPRNLIPVSVASRNNIFSASADRPLIAMSGSTDPDDFRKLLHWSGERNFYDRFVTFWSIASDLEDTESSFDFDRWKSYWGEATELDPHHEPVVWKFARWKTPTSALDLEHLALDDKAPNNPPVRGALNGGDAGVDLKKLKREAEIERSSPATEPPAPKPAEDDAATPE